MVLRDFFSRLTSRPPRPEAKQLTTILPGGDIPRYPAPSFETITRELYRRSELVFAAVRLVSTCASEPPLKVYALTDSGPQELPDHPLRTLLRRPNPHLSEADLWTHTTNHLYLAGNAFWALIRSRAGSIVEIWPLRPDWVRIYTDPSTGRIRSYGYVLDGREYAIPPEDVVHFKMPDPLDPVLGMPPVLAALRAAATDLEATDYTKALLQNRAVPGVVITTQQKLDEETAERLAEKWRQSFSQDRRGRPAFLQAGMEVHSLSHTLRDLEFPDLRIITEARVLSVLGVPPILLGVKAGLEASTLANYQQSRAAFYEHTISPLWRRLQDRINHSLLPQFPASENLEARFDLTYVPALQDSISERWKRAEVGTRQGFLTINEARALVGLPPIEGGDVFLRPQNLIPDSTQPAPDTRPDATP